MSAEYFRLFSYRDRGCTVLSVLVVLFCLSCPNRPILTDLSFLAALSWLYGLSWMLYCTQAVLLLSRPVLTVMSWLSYPSNPFLGYPVLALLLACSVLAVLSWLFCPGCPILAVRSWSSCSGYPVLTARAWLSWFWLSCSGCSVVTALVS